MKRDGGMCQWPGCGMTTELQMAHLVHRGMGGSPKANVLENVVMLCTYHHDILDGRAEKGRRHAVTQLLTHYLRTKR
jgi:hypothetical protein